MNLTGADFTGGVALATIPFTLQSGKSINDITRDTIRLETERDSEYAQKINEANLLGSLYVSSFDNTIECYLGSVNHANNVSYGFVADENDFPGTAAPGELARVTLDKTTVTVNGESGETRQTVQARAVDQRGTAFTDVTWSITSQPAGATVRPLELVEEVTINQSTGVITVGNNAAAGTYVVTATAKEGGKTASANLTVSRTAAAVGDLTLSISPTTITHGDAAAVSLTATDQYGVETHPTAQSWNITPAEATITVEGSQLKTTQATPVGTYTVSAVYGGKISNEVQITIQDKPQMEISGLSIEGRVYNGTPLAYTAGTVSGKLADGTVVSLTDADRKSVTYTSNGTILEGAPKDVGDYHVAVVYETADYIGTWEKDFSINPVELTIPDLAAENRPYDGTNKVDVSGTLSGVISGEDVKVALSGTVADKNADTGKDVTVTAVLTGAAKKNYVLGDLDQITVDISKRPVSIQEVKIADKTYDGTDAAVVESVKFDGVIEGEAGAVAYRITEVAFDDADAGEGIAVTGSLELTGSFAVNYELDDEEFTAEGDILPADFAVQLPYETVTIKKGTNGTAFLPDEDSVKVVPAVAGEAISNSDVAFTLEYNGEAIDADVIAGLDVGTYDLKWECVVDDPNYEGTKSGTFTLVVSANDATNIRIEGQPESIPSYGDDEITLDASTFIVNEDGTIDDGEDVEYVWTAEPEGIVEIDENGKVEIVGAGEVTITVSFRSSANAAASQTFTMNIQKKPITVTILLDGDSSADMIYGEALPEVTLEADGLVNGDDEDDLKVTLNTPLNPEVGYYTIDGRSSDTKYEITFVPAYLEVVKAAQADIEVAANTQSTAEGSAEVVIDLSAALAVIKGDYELSDLIAIVSGNHMVTEAKLDGSKLTVKYVPQAAGTEAVIEIPVDAANYKPFKVIVTLTSSDKIDVSDKIDFEDLTVTYNENREYSLAKAIVTIDGKKVETGFTYEPGGTEPPKYTEVGTYPVTATYEDDTHLGSKTAVLRIVDAFAPVSAGTVPAADDQNAGSYTVQVNPRSSGIYTININANTTSLKSYEHDGVNGAWVGIVPAFALNGNILTSYYFGESKDDLKLVNASDIAVWINTSVEKQKGPFFVATRADGSDAMEVTFVFNPYTPSSSRPTGSSGATHVSRDLISGSTSSEKKPDAPYTSTSRGTVVTTIESQVSDNGTVQISASTVTSRLSENGKMADYYDTSDTAIEIDTTGTRAASTVITMDTASISAISKARTALWLTTDSGEVRIGYNGLSKLAAQADGSTIVFTIGEASNGLFEVSAVSNGVQLTDLDGSSADITLDYPNGTYYVYLVSEGALDADGNVVDASKLTRVATNVRATGGELSFTAGLLGQYLITTVNYDSAARAMNFTDVPDTHWAIEAINDLAARGIVAGMGDGTFAPDAQVTREQFVRMLAGVSNEQQPSTTASRFTDVAPTAWSLTYIEWAANRGITYGTTATTFEPTAPISRQEMASMIYRYIQNSGKELPQTNRALTFNDQAEIGTWAAESVAVMQQAGVINGVAANGGYEFRPTNAATRAECAAMLSALIKLI